MDAVENNPAIKIQENNAKDPPAGLGISEESIDSPTLEERTGPKAPSDHVTSKGSSKELPDDHKDEERPATNNEPVHSPLIKSHGTPRHGPRTVHLPPQEVQEERHAKKQRQEARRRDAAEHDKPAVDAVSSPSTVGAVSTTTSMPTGPSPMTSADDDAATTSQTANNVQDQRISPDELSAKQKHDRLLQAQKEIAYREALGHDDEDSPDVQLRLEQEQAAKSSRDATEAANLVLSDTRPDDDGTSASALPSSAAVTAREQPPNSVTDVRSLEPSSESPTEITSSGVVPRKRAPRPSLVNIMPPRDPSLATAVVESSNRDKNDEASRIDSSNHKRGHTVEEVSRIKTEHHMIKRAQRTAPEKPQSPASKRFNEMLKTEGYAALKGAAEDPNKDYLEPLFRIQIHEPPNGKPLHELLQKASKVVTTSDQFAGIHEKQDQRILRRIYQLQNANRWSLRQMEPCAEPLAPKTHMDHLLSEMKWMRTDFREERKIKKATAKYIAEQCADWVNGDAATRQAMQIKLKSANSSRQNTVIPHSPAETNAENSDRHSQEARSPPGLDNDIESSVDDSDMPKTPQYATVVPSSFFADINMDKESFHLQDNEIFHSALAELPLLMPFEEEEASAQPTTRRPTPAVSKFCEIKMMTAVSGPTRKRSRFDYEDEDDLMDESTIKRNRASQDNSGLRPEQTDVALFEPENKLLRARLHANTAFRPPSEFQMPSSQFYEFRTASQWTEEDQQALRRLAKEYSFNWSLIADQLSLPSTFTSATDRRTPWECFERWVELESLPNEMRKTLYFKTWNQRLDAANRNNEAKYQAQLTQQAQTPGQPQTIVRRKTLPFKVDKRRQNRYLHTVDAMRKLARKREQQAHKQAEGKTSR